MDYKLIAIGAAVLALVGILVFFLAVPKTPSCEIEKMSGYLYGFGEAVTQSEADAIENAKKKAFSDLSRQILADVNVKEELRKVASLLEGKKLESEAYDLQVKLKSSLVIPNARTKVVCKYKKDGRYYAKVAVYIPKLVAKNLARAYLYAYAIKALTDSKLYCTASNMAEDFEMFTKGLLQPPPAVTEASAYISKARTECGKAKEVVEYIKKLDIKSPEGFMRFLTEIKKLKEITNDPPEYEELVKKMRESKVVAMNITGPSVVVKGQAVDLKVSLDPPPVGSYTVSVTAKDFNAPKTLMIYDGKASLKGTVKGEDCSVLLNLSDALTSTWRPDNVYPSTVSGVARALLDGVTFYKKVLFLPKTLSDVDITLARSLEKEALRKGISVMKAEEASSIFDKWLSEMTEEMLHFDGEVVFSSKSGDDFEISYDGGKKVISVENPQVSQSYVEKSVKEIYMKAAIAANASYPLSYYKDPLYETAVLILKGNLAEAEERANYIKGGKSYVMKAYINYLKGEYKKAVEYAKKAAEENPNLAYKIMAYSYAKIKDPMYLLNELRPLVKAVKNCGVECSSGYYAVAYLLDMFENYKEAKDWILKALDVDPDNPEYLIELGYIQIGLKDCEGAKETLEKIKGLKLKPSELESLREYENYLKKSCEK